MVEKKIKVLLVASEFAPGMIPYAATLINVLSKDERFEVHSVVVCSGKKTYRGVVDANNVTFVEYPQIKLAKMLYKLLPIKIIAAIRKEKYVFKPDIIHYLTCDFSLGLYNLLVSRKKTFWTVHDLHKHPVKSSFINYKANLERIYVRFWNIVMFNCIPNLTTSSYNQYLEMKKLYPTANCYYTHFPSLVTCEIAEGNSEVKEISELKDYILFFGHTGWYKGTDQLISAYNNSGISNPLVIAGRGVCDTLGNQRIFHVNRFIKDEEIAYLFKHAALVVYPYRETTMSGVLSLAYYFKKRVLVSSTPFFLENKVKGVEYFEAGNEKDLQDKLCLLIDNLSESDNLEIDAYDKIYSNKKMADDYFGMYNK